MGLLQCTVKPQGSSGQRDSFSILPPCWEAAEEQWAVDCHNTGEQWAVGLLQCTATLGSSGVMVSWCHLPGPAPSGAVARGPGRARAAQYRSKCNALSRCARTPPPRLALCPRPHGSGSSKRATRPVGWFSTEVHSVAAGEQRVVGLLQGTATLLGSSVASWCRVVWCRVACAVQCGAV